MKLDTIYVRATSVEWDVICGFIYRGLSAVQGEFVNRALRILYLRGQPYEPHPLLQALRLSGTREILDLRFSEVLFNAVGSQIVFHSSLHQSLD